MNLFKSSSELKSIAKGNLLGKYGTAISAFVVVELIVFFIQFLFSGLLNTDTLFGAIVYYCVMLIMQLLAAIFALGQSRLYLNMACNFKYGVGDVFYGFTIHPDKVIVIQFLLLLMETACVLPSLLFYYLYLTTNQPILMLLISTFAVIGGIAVCVIMLTYSQVNYLILDFPQYSALEIMKLSKKLMKGYKGKLFYLVISFLPICILALFTCCIGYLWVIPYINATYSQFYLELIRVKSAPNTTA